MYQSLYARVIFIVMMFFLAIGHSDEIALWQHKHWATLGFIRGISTPSRAGQAFCSIQWITLLFSIIESGLPSPGSQVKRIEPSTLLQQVFYMLINRSVHMKGVTIDSISAITKDHSTILAGEPQ